MQKEKINTFLVEVFNTILQLEDRALSSSHEFSNLSVNEFHVIEAVIACGENSSMSAVSRRLGITVGSLTVAVKTLTAKGYLRREKRINDMRMVYVVPTERGIAANEYHSAFHHKMVDAVMAKLPEEELDTLVSALEIVAGFFADTRESRGAPSQEAQPGQPTSLTL
ncbi:MAG: MarR family transcriptional regulator [Clostridiales bacterium]|nr:MarR family transcriptional regulator [Clostridiales bacterium]